jgi:acetyl-CoA carboxylase carboxyltransferase component
MATFFNCISLESIYRSVDFSEWLVRHEPRHRVDAIIDPSDTRKLIAEGFAAANHDSEMAEFKTGVFQV